MGKHYGKTNNNKIIPVEKKDKTQMIRRKDVNVYDNKSHNRPISPIIRMLKGKNGYYNLKWDTKEINYYYGI